MRMHTRAASGQPNLGSQSGRGVVVADDMLTDNSSSTDSALIDDDTFNALLNDELDRPHEACGVFGIYAPGEEVARRTYFALFARQRRGQGGAGIFTGDGAQLYHHVEMGLVSQVFNEETIASLPRYVAIGHTRSSTTGSTRIENAQPVHMVSDLGEFALAHNGNLTNTLTLRA